jgi:hypothetical protein
MTNAETSIKTAARKTARPGKRAVTWTDVLRVAQDGEARSLVVQAYRAAGFAPDDFAGGRLAREFVANALTRLEDSLEHKRGARNEERRAEAAKVRRALELELWR